MGVRERHRAARRGRHSVLAVVAAVALFGGATAATAAVTQLAAGAQAVPHIEICKVGPVSGTFQFTVDGGPPFGVIANGACVGVNVTAGKDHTVTELADPTGQTVLTNIAVLPGTQQKKDEHQPGWRRWIRQSEGRRTSGTNASVETQFTNDPAYGELKVCKVADASSAGLTGTYFTFTASQGGNIQGPSSIPAAAPGNPYSSCWDVGSYQVGSSVSVAEQNTAGVQVDSVTTSNGTNTAPVAGPTATATNVTLTGGVTEVSFDNGYNLPPVTGNLEVCEVISDEYVPVGAMGLPDLQFWRQADRH